MAELNQNGEMIIKQLQGALTLEQAKVQAGNQTISEIINANLGLKTGTILLTQNVNDANTKLNDALNKVQQLEQQLGLSKDELMTKISAENEEFKKENDRLGRVVGAFDIKLNELLRENASLREALSSNAAASVPASAPAATQDDGA